jgi:hypothetical protein
MPEGMKDNVARGGLDAYFIQHIRKAIANGKYATASWCADVRGQTDGETLIPASLVHLEDANSFSEDILIAYRKNEGGKILFWRADQGTNPISDTLIFLSAAAPSLATTLLFRGAELLTNAATVDMESAPNHSPDLATICPNDRW